MTILLHQQPGLSVTTTYPITVGAGMEYSSSVTVVTVQIQHFQLSHQQVCGHTSNVTPCAAMRSSGEGGGSVSGYVGW